MTARESSDEREIARRQVIAGAISSLIVAPVLTGCIAGLLRLFVGRGLAGTLARTARVGRAASTLTFGRGVAVGAKVVPASMYRATSGTIIGPKQRLVATFDTSLANSIIKIDRSPVFTSQRTRYGFEHFDRNGICGRSYVRADRNEIRHETDDGILLAIDRINEASRTIEHHDPSSRRIGTSKYGVRGNDVDVNADQASIESMDRARDELGLQCPETKHAYDEWLEAKQLCGRGDGEACRAVATKRIKYENLRRHCTS